MLETDRNQRFDAAPKKQLQTREFPFDPEKSGSSMLTAFELNPDEIFYNNLPVTIYFSAFSEECVNGYIIKDETGTWIRNVTTGETSPIGDGSGIDCAEFAMPIIRERDGVKYAVLYRGLSINDANRQALSPESFFLRGLSSPGLSQTGVIDSSRWEEARRTNNFAMMWDFNDTGATGARVMSFSSSPYLMAMYCTYSNASKEELIIVEVELPLNSLRNKDEASRPNQHDHTADEILAVTPMKMKYPSIPREDGAYPESEYMVVEPHLDQKYISAVYHLAGDTVIKYQQLEKTSLPDSV